MTIALWCVLIAAFLPYIWTGLAKVSRPGFDNSQPRVFLGDLEGWGQRANWAQMNSFEAFPPFAAAVIIGHQFGNIDPGLLDNLAILFILCRLLYGVFYIIDQHILRTLVWTGGIVSWVMIFIQSA